MANFEILVGTKLNDTIQKQLDKSPVKNCHRQTNP